MSQPPGSSNNHVLQHLAYADAKMLPKTAMYVTETMNSIEMFKLISNQVSKKRHSYLRLSVGKVVGQSLGKFVGAHKR